MAWSLHWYYLSLSHRWRSTCSSSCCFDLCKVNSIHSFCLILVICFVFFFRFIDHSSFLPNQWPIHSLLKWINSSCQWVYQLHHSYQQINTPTKEILDENISCLTTLIFDRLAQATTRIQIVCFCFSKFKDKIICFFSVKIGCLEGILALVNSLNTQTIRSFFHYQYDQLRVLVHFFKHPFILHDLNNLQLLLEIIFSIFSSKFHWNNK